MRNAIKKLLPDFLLGVYYIFWPFLGALIYRFPGKNKNIKIIGITGTNGKTTITHLATDILEAAGYKVASISSLRFKIGNKEYKNELKMTMPGRMKIQKFLRQVVNAGCRYIVIEVTSEGIKQHRHEFIKFDVAVFTNLTPEHIESHGSFEKYKEAKGELFKIAKTAIINLDDENAEYFAGLCKGEKRGYAIFNFQFSNFQVLKASDINLELSLLGEFNLYNALAAACVGLSQGIDIKIIKQVLEREKSIPGRMEVVVREPFPVIVDYAHTPDALEKIYKTILSLKFRSVTLPPSPSTDYNIVWGGGAREDIPLMICVLGAAGGGRDKWKRPEMGKIAAQYCDEIILTDEDPYDESPQGILEDIEKGIPYYILHSAYYRKILDRRQAIKKALQLAKPGNTVIITGKGAEPWMMTKNGKVPWDDREIVKEEISALG